MDKKKLGIILVVVLVIVLIIAASIGGSGSKSEGSSTGKDSGSYDAEQIVENAQKESDAVKDSEKKELTNINVDTYLEYFNGEEKKVILLARPTCGYCEIAMPIIQKVAKDYDLEINYLNSDEFEGEDEAKFVASSEEFKEYGTPTLFIVSNGEVVSMVEGLTDYAHYEQFFKDNGFID